MCPTISKIFENCLLHCSLSSVKTSDRQFGFKKGVGCANSIHTVRKVIDFFNLGNSTVNVGVIDLKKAFSKVNVFGLLKLLQEKNIDFRIIKVLENWFSKCYSSTRWGGSRSEYCKLFSGVREGGILSPLLFCLFVDVLLSKLERSGLGCFVNFTCYNSFLYADDIILLSISINQSINEFSTVSLPEGCVSDVPGPNQPQPTPPT